MMRLAVLGSTRGTNLTALVEAIRAGTLPASIELVVSNKADALILDKAKQFGLTHQFVNPHGLSREEYDEQLSLILLKYRIDLIVLIGYMRILSPNFVGAWRDKIINIHPSLLPDFSGLMNIAVHRAVLDSGNKITGCTVHYVTEDVDAGPILLQKTCPVLPDDTPERLRTRVQQLEGTALADAIATIAEGKRPTFI
ncbi:phosphoribosylglycinamide formyltransferase [Legionella spiritensis]|uniref:Phosphoribosylglycinamide formyltransferase n=1 Tax=Legionella spiritensis TaxID=452 RepID=A0A0W0Z8X4_LEGSP|nr:phosphoribosylglycinamide formyltransferase [Legionella spiritensis]KTD65543.1 phosphoribosylglycinamide formyltransferase [Legionella spiritensis]SNV44564.1 phosphoribosylglycinamide formyltransferase [Legionella spiritensis]VEG90829.1 phosphoribosylglycinamide formyltransferase [Legionella spiritensis]